MHMHMMARTVAMTLVLVGASRLPAHAQAPATPQDQPPARSDRAVNPAEPDFTLIGLPTTLRIPRFGSAFRVTHRFMRPLGAGDFGNLVEDFFGFDGGAQIGLEFRFGIVAGTQIGIHRTNDRTIQFFLQHQVFRQGDRSPVTVDALATVDGTNNFRDSYSPALGAVISRAFGRYGAVYLEPVWVNNTNDQPSEVVDDNDTFIIGVGGRVRVRPTLYVVAEMAPRFGYDPGVVHASFGIEKRAGGHSFQINFSNSFGTTMAQIARGGLDNDDWYIGFNISRKFF
jgi:hypothetical protein